MVLRITSSGDKVRGCPGSIKGWVMKKSIHLIYVLYILYVIYMVYILYKYYIYIYIYIYIAYICRVKSEWYIIRTSFTTYIGKPTRPMVLRMTSSGYKVRGCSGSKPGWVLKKEKIACI